MSFCFSVMLVEISCNLTFSSGTCHSTTYVPPDNQGIFKIVFESGPYKYRMGYVCDTPCLKFSEVNHPYNLFGSAPVPASENLHPSYQISIDLSLLTLSCIFSYPLQIKPPVSAPQVTIIEPEIPKEAPPEYEFLADPPSISSLDL